MRKLKREKMCWAYVAGFFDGEGYVRVVMRNGGLHRAEVSMSQSIKQDAVLDEIAKFLKSHGIIAAWATGYDVSNPNASPSRSLRISREEHVTAFLEGVSPFLIVKNQRAKEALGHLAERKAMRAKHGKYWRKALALTIVVLSTCGGTSTAHAKNHPHFKASNQWIRTWARRDESIYPAMQQAAKMFDISYYTLKNIVSGEGGNVNPRTLKSSLCSYSGTGWNTAGSSAFGPFQFMLDYRGACMDSSSWGTFGVYDDDAFKTAKKQGTAVPYRFKHPASNVGQAITAAYMIRYRTGISPWCASQC